MILFNLMKKIFEFFKIIFISYHVFTAAIRNANIASPVVNFNTMLIKSEIALVMLTRHFFEAPNIVFFSVSICCFISSLRYPCFITEISLLHTVQKRFATDFYDIFSIIVMMLMETCTSSLAF